MTSPLQQKLKISGPVVVTANRLGDGAVIYRTADSRWSTDLEDAAVVTTAPAASVLLEGGVADDIGAVGAYVAPVRVEPDGSTNFPRDQSGASGGSSSFPIDALTLSKASVVWRDDVLAMAAEANAV